MNRKIILLFGLLIIFVVVVYYYNNLDRDNAGGGGTEIVNLESDPNMEYFEEELTSSFPSFPVYEGAILERSGRLVQSTNDRGHHALWKVATNDGVRVVMQWYVDSLEKDSWDIIEYPEDPNQGEQFLRAIKNDTFVLVVVEKHSDEEVEVFVDFPLTYEI